MARLTPEETARRNALIEELKPTILTLDGEHGGSNKRIADALNARNVPNLAGKPWTPAHVSNFKQRYLSVKTATTSTIPDTSSTDAALAPEPQPEASSSDSVTATRDWDDIINIPVTDDSAPLDVDAFEELDTVEVSIDIATTSGIIDSSLDDSAATADISATSVPGLNPEMVTFLNQLHESGELTALISWWRKGQNAMMPTKRPILRGPAGRGRVNSGLLLDCELKDRALAAAKRDPAATGGSLSLLIELLLWRYLGEPQEFLVPDTSE
jgi:hypothetical protein